jgi:hypothetical protein
MSSRNEQWRITWFLNTIWKTILLFQYIKLPWQTEWSLACLWIHIHSLDSACNTNNINKTENNNLINWFFSAKLMKIKMNSNKIISFSICNMLLLVTISKTSYYHWYFLTNFARILSQQKKIDLIWYNGKKIFKLSL